MRLQWRTAAITSPGVDLPIADQFVLGLDADLGADAVGVALGADGLDAQPILVVRVVAVEDDVGIIVDQTAKHCSVTQRLLKSRIVFDPLHPLWRGAIAMSQTKSYVTLDEYGVYRVGDTKVMVDSVVAAFHQGHSPETIQQQYPALSLEDVYGSIAYYLAHAAEVDAYLRRQDAEWDAWRTHAEKKPSAVAERLRALRRAGVSEPP